MTSTNESRKRVAIIGGGCAAMAAAWELTQPCQHNRFEVTVYQMGWRLGGKGASGRGAAGRIEEHGLHLWMGHYDNAFRLMREVYGELNRDPQSHKLASWRDAFVPDAQVGLADVNDAGEWRNFLAYFPPMPGTPGDPRAPLGPSRAGDYLQRIVILLIELVQSAAAVDKNATGNASDQALPDSLRWSQRANFSGGLETIVQAVASLLSYGQIATLSALRYALSLLQAALEQTPGLPVELYGRFLEIIIESINRLLPPLLQGSSTAKYSWEIIDLILACLRGSFRHQLSVDPKGLDAIDDYDIRDWLLDNGAAQSSVDSAFVRGLYDLAFAYEDGDPQKPALAAGPGLRGGFRMFFNYREALFWKMQGGMGDVVFVPLYEALRQRGVKFEFFHRLDNVGLCTMHATDEAAHVARLDFSVQATTNEGQIYWPLVDIDGMNCWPNQPNWSQLAGGTHLSAADVDFESFWDDTDYPTKTLRVEEDFDFVVLGIGLGAVPHTCAELLEFDPRWRDMVEKVKTVSTQALQLWMRDDLADLGWHNGSANVSGFVEPFDTWADMSHLLDYEAWADPAPRSIAYFCNVLPGSAPSAEDLNDADYPKRYADQVEANARRFLEQDIKHLWPKAVTPSGSFRWELLCNARTSTRPQEPKQGPKTSATLTSIEHRNIDTLSSQFWTANVNPSDRYVLSLPGSTRYRISPLARTLDNLTIAGDWTDCGFNLGCVEAAVMSGRLASHALSLSPALEDIDAYDHT